ncbi:hypothetical protein JI440_001890 [Escherichia coli]|nr:hypothetical protein [Escherichia coli]
MSRNTEATDDVKTWTGGPLNYKEGFFTQLATDELAKGINEEVVRAISAKRNEPEWMLKFRLNAYRAQLEHEATTSRIGEDQLFYCLQRGISEEDAISMIVNGFCKDVFSELPLEFAVEAQKLLAISLEHSVG